MSTIQPPDPSSKRKIPALPRAFGAWFIGIVVAAVVILNTWASLDDVPNNTISAAMTVATRFFGVVLPMGIAGVFGHWCSRGLTLRTPSADPLPEVPGGPLVFLGVIVLIGILDVLTEGKISRYPFILQGMFALSLGAVLWPMRLVAT